MALQFRSKQRFALRAPDASASRSALRARTAACRKNALGFLRRGSTAETNVKVYFSVAQLLLRQRAAQEQAPPSREVARRSRRSLA